MNSASPSWRVFRPANVSTERMRRAHQSARIAAGSGADSHVCLAPRSSSSAGHENEPLLKLAQKYIYGQGGRADCVTGMAYLRQAMKRPNYAAASQMGALYATGTCVPLNRVEAYRYFSSAMQMAPSNPYLGQERDKLYGQMTSGERRQADQQQ